MPVDIESLRGFAHFANVPPDELEAIGHLVFEKSVDKNDMILFEGETSDALYFVLSGAVKVPEK